MTTNHEPHTMGDLLRFPVPRTTSETVPRAGETVEDTVEPIDGTAEATPEESREVFAPSGTDLALDRERALVPAAVAGRAARVRQHVREHGWDYTKTGSRFVARHSVFLLGGAWDTASGVYARWTGRDIDARIAAAQAAGEHGVVAQLSAQRIEDKKLLLERVQVWGQFLVRLPLVLGGVAVISLVTTLIASIVALVRPGGLDFAGVWDGFFAILTSGFEWTVWAATVGLPALLLATGTGLLVQGYNQRRRRNTVPAFLAAPGSGAGEVEVTPSVVVSALRRAGIPALRRAIESMDEHQRAAMLSPIKLAGCGVEVDVTLPSSGDTTVTTEQVRAKRRALAEGLGRHEHEVFITKAPAARTVRLWIADSGALDEPIGGSPLVGEGFDKADIFSGKAPWGVTLRGDAFLLKLWQCHLLITGLSNQGKTAALRSLLLWLLLDPSVEVHLADLKGVGDYNMLKPLVSTYIAGPTDEHHVPAATDMVEWAVGEMNRRIDEIESNADKYPNGITAALSRDVTSGFHPIVLVVDEAQVAYECGSKDEQGVPYGGTKSNSRFYNAVRKIQNQGRAVNVTVWQGTQDPTNDNLPIRVRNGAHIRASLVVATESQSRMALGDAAVNAGGAAPHELRQGKDKGVLVVKDADNTIETVRTHFIDGASAEQVAERARILRAGTRFRHSEHSEEDRDLLVDVESVLEGADKVKATDVVARLRKLAPHHRAYQTLDGAKLKEQLDAMKVDVKKADGIPTVYTHRVHSALAAREEGSEPS